MHVAIATCQIQLQSSQNGMRMASARQKRMKHRLWISALFLLPSGKQQYFHHSVWRPFGQRFSEMQVRDCCNIGSAGLGADAIKRSGATSPVSADNLDAAAAIRSFVAQRRFRSKETARALRRTPNSEEKLQ